MSQIAVADLTKDQADAELAWLADELAAHDLRYHQQDAPTISDGEYDALKRRNLDIEARFPDLIRENSPSMRVGAARAEQFSPVEHGVPMLSLDNAFSNDEDDASSTPASAASCASPPTSRCSTPPSPRSTASRPRCATRRACWSRARRGATAGSARTSPPTCGPSPTFPNKLKGAGWPDVIEIRGEVYVELEAFAAFNAAALEAGLRTSPIPATSPPARCARSTPRSAPSGRCGSSPTPGACVSGPFAAGQWEALGSSMNGVS